MDLQATQISSFVPSATLQVISDLLHQFVPDTLTQLFRRLENEVTILADLLRTIFERSERRSNAEFDQDKKDQ